MTFVCPYCACYQTKITYKTQILNNTHAQTRDHLYKNIPFFWIIWSKGKSSNMVSVQFTRKKRIFVKAISWKIPLKSRQFTLMSLIGEVSWINSRHGWDEHWVYIAKRKVILCIMINKRNADRFSKFEISLRRDLLKRWKERKKGIILAIYVWI